VVAGFSEPLILSPRARQRWLTPQECLLRDFSDDFGTLAGYLNGYADALELWRQLQVSDSPGHDFLVGLWARLAATVEATDKELDLVLARSYVLAQSQVSRWPERATEVMVVAADRWVPASSAYATSSGELADVLTSEGLARWEMKAHELVPQVADWLGVTDVDRHAQFVVLPNPTTVDPQVEGRVHRAVAGFASEIRTAHPELWSTLRRRLRDVIHGRVVTVDPLRLRVDVTHPKLKEASFDVPSGAFHDAGNLYLSRLTDLSDREVAEALLARLPLHGDARWAATNALQLQLIRGGSSEVAFPEDTDSESAEPEAQPSAGAGSSQRPSAKAPAREKPIKRGDEGKRKEEEPPFPVDGYLITSDVGSDSTVPPAGGLVPRKPVQNRPPGGGRGGGGGGGGPDRHSRRSTEQRGVELYRRYVLDPAGIEVKDVRLKRGVGADLVGTDDVFRELKTHSGAAPQSESLTEHEFVRAGNTGRTYELVVVENVWDKPTITVVTNPLSRLKYTPTGGVIVQGWREPKAAPRVVELGKPSESQASREKG
jgi:hypothetical protein